MSLESLNHDSFRPLRLVVVIPAYNEAATIERVIDSIPEKLPGFLPTQVLVIDDGSNDSTGKLAEDAGAIVFRHPRNLGLGKTFADGIDQALTLGADVIVNMDGDGQFPAHEIPKLVAPIVESNFGFVTCTRFQDRAKFPKMPFIKIIGNRGMCWIVNRITGQKFTDVSCGFRAYSRETALRLNLFGRFTYTQESFIDLASKSVAMTEVPLGVRGVREFGKSRMASSLWRYGLRTLGIILRAMRDTNPLAIFGAIAAVFLLLGFASFASVGLHWVFTGHTSPWGSLLFVGTAATMIGVGTGILAAVSDQIRRGRMIQENLLYLSRRQYYDTLSNRDSNEQIAFARV